tara:strand:- start:1855 stop:2238 length:384 start_codon:yes stop_codon:yes gene_type:complete
LQITILKRVQTDFSGTEWPAISGVSELQSQYVLDLVIKPDIVWFEGHFPGEPVLAGVVQTHWAAEFAKYFFSVGEDFKRIENLKFKAVILPEMRLQLTLIYLPDKNAVTFRYANSAQDYSVGKLVFS